MTLNYFRNLYRVLANGNVVAFITAASADAASMAYYKAGGKAADLNIERMSFGYPEDVCTIYA